mmetsp:Transcript_9790/g.15036  ORF Transcript_9790/g.15036 Transcript_9790/m.15036 type:complete len:735 (+) Transcript_9790:139-2343(+)
MISTCSSFELSLTLRFILKFVLCCSTCRIINAFVTEQPHRNIPVAKSFGRHSPLFLQKDDGETMKRGDTRGAALLVENLAVSRGPAQILSDINFRVEPKSKWGVVGPNGAGKSTLLKAILGQLLNDDGSVTVGTTQKVGYLQQTAVSGSNRTIYDEAASAMEEITTARKKLEAAQESVASADVPDEESLAALDRATQNYELLGGYTQEQEVETVLKGLGFTNTSQTCDSLSGGWQMRVSLAKLLLSKPSLLLLDEPSNHLDVNARKWLAQYMSNYEAGAMVLVTHDVDLLSSVQHIAEVAGGSLQEYKTCTHTQYLDMKEQRAKLAASEYERNLEKAAKLQAFVDKWGASATKAKAAQSRVKMLEKMQKSGELDAPTDLMNNQARFKPSMVLPEPPRSIGETLLALKNGAQVGYSADKPLVSNIELDIKRGMKLLLRGPNGAGKSTILHSLRGTLPLLKGDRVENESLRLGSFTQDLAQELDGKAIAVDLVTAYAREGSFGDISFSDNEARSVLGRLGLGDDKPLRRIEDLSGGEKARVALAMFSVKASNILILDEPSNHLDQECIKALSDSLTDWGEDDGAVVVVSHDRAFCQEIDFTHVGTVEKGNLIVEQRGVSGKDWDVFDGESTRVSLGKSSPIEEEKRSSSSSSSLKKELDKQTRKQLYNAPKRIAKLESLIEKAEEKIAELDQEMLENGSDVGKLVDLTAKREEEEERVLEYMEEWEELEELLLQVQ